MNDVMQAVGVFFSYAVLAVFAQNAVFTRGLGVSRLVQLVGDERTSSGWFALLLCVTQVLVAPLAFYAGGFVAAQSNPAQLRPLVYLACVAVVSLFEFIVLWAARGQAPRRPAAPHPAAGGGQQRRAGYSAGGAHPELYAGAEHGLRPRQRPGLSAGRHAGDGADRRLRSEAIPEASGACPSRSSTSGVLALAIYGFYGATR